MTNFTEFLNKNREPLQVYTKAITRAHGKNHPEVFEVHRLYTELDQMMANNGSQADIEVQMAKMKELTHNYHIPSDVCPTFKATYETLAQADQLFHA